jgi:hypothetical protein
LPPSGYGPATLTFYRIVSDARPPTVVSVGRASLELRLANGGGDNHPDTSVPAVRLEGDRRGYGHAWILLFLPRLRSSRSALATLFGRGCLGVVGSECDKGRACLETIALRSSCEVSSVASGIADFRKSPKPPKSQKQ